jgi:phospholipid-binding lipoprotein MlaA
MRAMQLVRSLLRLLAPLAASAALGACASIPPNAGSNPADPWERYNRHMSEFNDRVDAAVIRPVARAYVTVVPGGVRDCVTNFFANANDVPNALNNLLQGKVTTAASDLCRVAINTTVGLLGCFDVASRMGLERSEEDFGQTLGKWGAEQGPFFVWPLLGPSTVRDSLGRVVGFYTNPVNYVDSVRLQNSLWGLSLVDTRASLFPVERLLDGALDRYQFIRDAYLQRRRSLVFDGNPPRIKDDDEEVQRDGDLVVGALAPFAETPP